MRYEAPRFGNFAFDFQRVNVILGANGSGKSRLLSDLRDAVPGLTGAKPVFIEGGRAIKITDVIQLDAKSFQRYDKLNSALIQYERKRTQSLADRVYDALIVLEKRELQLKAQHSDRVEQWVAGGREGPYPTRPRAPLTRLLDLFGEIFPHITLSFDYDARRLNAHKGGEKYGVSTLSDGEKQVFSVLADLIDLEESHKVIVADEPELNLHPELAERLWNLVEGEFPDKTFIYATHSIAFALRDSVDTVFVLSSQAEQIATFNGFEDLPKHELHAFLGSLPGILSTNSVVVTEGHERSFDALFYRWVLSDAKVEVVPAGGCNEVVAVVSKAGIWSKVSSSIAMRGVVDADFRDDAYLSSLEGDGRTVLQLHEAESYLCVPEVLTAIADRIGSQEHPLTIAAVEDAIVQALRDQKLSIAARRVFARTKITLAVSVERKVLAAAETRDALVAELRSAARAELEKAEQRLGDASIEAALDKEIAEIEAICADRRVMEALRVLPAKGLLNSLAPRAGCKSAPDLMRALRRHFAAEDFHHTKTLKQAILGGPQSEKDESAG